MTTKRDDQNILRHGEGTNDGGKFAPENLGEAIYARGDLTDITRMVSNLADQIENYDRAEARLNLTEHKKDVAYKTYLDAAEDHDRNTLRAIGDWAGAEYPEAKTMFIGSAGDLWLQTDDGKPVRVPTRFESGLSDNYADILPGGSVVPVEVLRNIEWITDEEIIELDLGDTLPLEGFTDDVFESASLSRDVDGSLTLEFERQLDLAGILDQQGHDLDGMSADEYAYEHQLVLAKVISDRYGLMINNLGEEHATIGGYVTDENWTEASAEQISGLLYSSDLVRFYNESDNGSNGSENLSRILVEAVKSSRSARAA